MKKRQWCALLLVITFIFTGTTFANELGPADVSASSTAINNQAQAATANGNQSEVTVQTSTETSQAQQANGGTGIGIGGSSSSNSFNVDESTHINALDLTFEASHSFEPVPIPVPGPIYVQGDGNNLGKVTPLEQYLKYRLTVGGYAEFTMEELAPIARGHQGWFDNHELSFEPFGGTKGEPVEKIRVYFNPPKTSGNNLLMDGVDGMDIAGAFSFIGNDEATSMAGFAIIAVKAMKHGANADGEDFVRIEITGQGFWTTTQMETWSLGWGTQGNVVPSGKKDNVSITGGGGLGYFTGEGYINKAPTYQGLLIFPR